MDADTTGISPAWKNPRERLKKHLKRTSTSRSLRGSLENAAKATSTNDENLAVVSDNPSTIRRNPFKRRRSELKVNISYNVPDSWDDSNANDPFSNEKVLRSNKINRTLSRSFALESDHSFKESFPTDFSDVLCCSAFSPSTAAADSYSSDKMPTDLRLGTKLKVISRKPFPWMRDAKTSGLVPVRVTGQQQHEGMQYFLNNVATNFNSLSSDIAEDSSPMAFLESACLYWQFPCFPWLSTYPREDSLVNASANINHSIPTLAQPFLEALDLQWTQCFDQLFLSWKKGDRRSFYMSCSSFTVLFTKIAFCDSTEPGEDSLSCFQASDGRRHVAVITPSSIGLRQYLKTEGIEYEVIRRKLRHNTPSSTRKVSYEGDSRSSLDCFGVTQSQPPLFSIENDSVTGSQANVGKEGMPSENQPDESPENADLSGDHEWLENIGVSPRNTAKLRKYKSLVATYKFNDDESQSKSGVEDVAGVLVKGPEVQTLYNLLQSSRICRSIAGPHVNLPPTLTAAQPFLYAQMYSLKKTSQVIRRKVSEYVLELDGGPVMPHSLPLESFFVILILVAFIRGAELCNDDPVTIRVSGRSVCNGVNEVDSDLYDWNELRVEREKFSWDKM